MNNLLFTIKAALRGLMVNAGRSFLTMLGIIIGVAAIITIVSVGEGAQALLTGSIANAGTKNVRVFAGASNDNGPPAAAQGIVVKTLTYNDAEALANLPFVDFFDAEIGQSFDLKHQQTALNAYVTGNTAQYPQTVNQSLFMGRFFTPEEEKQAKKVIVMGKTLAEDFFGADVRQKSPLGQKITINKEIFTLIGIFKAQGGSFFRNPDTQAFVPLKTMQKRLLNVSHTEIITLTAADESFIPFLKENAEKTLRYRHGIDDPRNDDFDIRSVSQALGIISGVTGAVNAFLTLIAALSLLVGGLGVMNIMLMNISQRTREIGLRKALGATPETIQAQFLLESLVLTVLGGVLGALLGVGLAYGIFLGVTYAGYDWVFVISPLSVLFGVLTAGLTGFVFGYGPSKQAAQLNAIDALRHE